MTIFVVGGGTGGHLFPAIALGKELARLGSEVALITDTRCKGYIGPQLGLETHILSLGSMKYSFFAKALMAIKLVFASLQSIILLRRRKASIVVGFGGYTAFPPLIAAKLLGIPIMLHEQNCFFGKVNKLFAKSAKVIALNFAETSNVSEDLRDKIIIVGNPVRPEIKLAYKKRTFLKDGIKILVIGGSQGAKVFADIVPRAIAILKSIKPELKISITQQASSIDHEKLRAAYSTALEIPCELEEFFHDMPRKYSESDLVICRSGASTIAELIHLGQPAILIPYPFAAEDHQFFNANVLASKSAAWCFRQKDLTPEILSDKIIEIANTPETLEKMSERLLSLRMESEKILADTVLK
ncbi:MAG: undecaprenyldiphospho-muramoylpentapeptide beta-N-acetylglucosaminyltransferase [Pseudomonadota bacterium]